MRRPIALVGFMGAGKTTVGKALARELDRRFVDLDAEVSRRTNLSVPAIFDERGERAFRKIEADALAEVVADLDTVIGCGGGVVTTAGGRRALSKALVVYLAMDESALVSRLAKTRGRPLLEGLEGDALAARVHKLLAKRRPLYAQVADIAVDAARPTAEVVKRINREMLALGYDDRDRARS